MSTYTKKAISAIIMAAFLLTQCGLGQGLASQKNGDCPQPKQLTFIERDCPHFSFFSQNLRKMQDLETADAAGIEKALKAAAGGASETTANRAGANGYIFKRIKEGVGRKPGGLSEKEESYSSWVGIELTSLGFSLDLSDRIANTLVRLRQDSVLELVQAGVLTMGELTSIDLFQKFDLHPFSQRIEREMQHYKNAGVKDTIAEDLLGRLIIYDRFAEIKAAFLEFSDSNIQRALLHHPNDTITWLTNLFSDANVGSIKAAFSDISDAEVRHALLNYPNDTITWLTNLFSDANVKPIKAAFPELSDSDIRRALLGRPNDTITWLTNIFSDTNVGPIKAAFPDLPDSYIRRALLNHPNDTISWLTDLFSDTNVKPIKSTFPDLTDHDVRQALLNHPKAPITWLTNLFSDANVKPIKAAFPELSDSDIRRALLGHSNDTITWLTNLFSDTNVGPIKAAFPDLSDSYIRRALLNHPNDTITWLQQTGGVVSGFAAGEATDGTAAGANMTGKATGNSRFKKIKLGLLLLSGTLLTQVPSDTITVEKYLDVDLQRHSRRLDREILPVEKRPLENLKRNQSEKNTEAGNVLPDTNEDAFELLLRSLKQYASQLNQTDINEMIIKQKSAKGQSSIRAMRVFLQQEKIPVFVVNTLANWSKLLDAIDEPKGCIGLTCQSPIDGRVVIVVYKGQLDGDVFVHEGTHAAIYVKVRKPMILAGRYIGNVSEILTSNTKDWIRNIQVVHSDFVDKRGHRLTGRARERAFQLYLCENIMQQLKKAAKSGRISGDRFLELNEILAWIYNIAAFPNVKHHIQTRAEREFFKKGRKDPRKDPNYPGPAMKEVMKRLKRPENAKVKDWLVDRFKEIGLPNPWQLSTVPFVGTSVPGRAVGAVTAEAKGGGEANAAAQIEQTAVIGKAAKVETAGVTANAAPSNNTKETFYLQELAKRKALIQGLIDKSSAYRTNNPRGSKPALVKDVITVLQTQAAITQFGVSERYLQTYGAGPCFILAIYDPATKTAALAHIDDKTDVAASIFQMLSKMNLSSRENLQARIIGGYGYSIRSVDDTIGLVNNLRAENIDIVEIGWNESSTDSAAVIIDSETGEVFNMRGAVDHPEFRAAEMIRMLEIQRAGGSKIPARILEAGRFLEYEIVAPVRSSSDELLFGAGGGVGVFGDTAIANGVGAASRATGTQANATSDEQTLSISELNWDDELIKLRELVEEIIAMSDVLDDTALLQIAQKSLQPIQQLLQVLSSQQPSLLSSDETIMPTRNDATPREIMAIFVRVLKLIKGSLKAPADKSNTPTLLKNVDMNTLLPLLKKSLLAIKQSLSQDIEGVNRKKISSAAGATSEARGSRAVGAVSAEAKGGGQTSDNVTGNIESSVTIINEQTRNLGHVEEFRLVAFLKSEQIGAVIYKLFSNSPDTIWISRIYVKEGYRRNGIGQRLLRALLEEARKRGKTKIALLCAKRNVAALRFYRTMAKRFGMQIDEKNVIGFYKITYSRLPKSAGLRAIVGNTSSAAASDRGAGEAAATAASPAEAAPPANEPASAIGKIEMHIVSRNEEAFIRQILSIYPEYAENEVKLTLHAKNIKNGHEALIVAMSKTAKTILGFALCTNEDVGKIYIDLLFTHIGYRRQGVARSLMWYCQRHFTTITLHNEVSDPIIKQAMNNLYFSLGFTNERGNRFLWSRSIAGHVSNALSTALAQGATPALAVATQARVDGESEQSPAEATGIEPTAEELKKIAGQKSVLLIDGQPARRETIRQIIFAMGFYVYVADTPEEAMSKYTGLADLVIDMTDEDITEIERNLQILQGNVIKLQGLDEELLRDKVNEWLIDQWRQTQA